jgi:hypothetical protein
MKKIKIIIGSLLAIFLMMMLPSASAVEANAAKETTIYSSETLDIFLKLKERYDDDNVEPTFIILYTLLIQLLRVLRMIDVGILLVILNIIRKIIGNRTTTDLTITNI